MANRRFHCLFRQRSHTLSHAQADVVGNRELRPQSRFQVFKALQKFPQWRTAEPDVSPYCKLGQQAGGIFLGGIELCNQVLVRLKARNPAFDLTRNHMPL